MAFFIRTKQGDVYEMDATVSNSASHTGRPTSYTMADGKNTSDHYVQEFDTYTFSGFVSSVKFQRRREGTGSNDLLEFEQDLIALKNSGERFDISAYNVGDSYFIIPNCLFTDLRTERNAETGIHSIKVDFTVNRIETSNLTDVSEETEPAIEFVDVVEERSSANGNTIESEELEDKKIADTVKALSPTIGSLPGL